MRAAWTSASIGISELFSDANRNSGEAGALVVSSFLADLTTCYPSTKNTCGVDTSSSFGAGGEKSHARIILKAHSASLCGGKVPRDATPGESNAGQNHARQNLWELRIAQEAQQRAEERVRKLSETLVSKNKVYEEGKRHVSEEARAKQEHALADIRNELQHARRQSEEANRAQERAQGAVVADRKHSIAHFTNASFVKKGMGSSQRSLKRVGQGN